MNLTQIVEIATKDYIAIRQTTWPSSIYLEYTDKDAPGFYLVLDFGDTLYRQKYQFTNGDIKANWTRHHEDSSV